MTCMEEARERLKTAYEQVNGKHVEGVGQKERRGKNRTGKKEMKEMLNGLMQC